jgi:sigma-B regulation protein RsbU (phosphoserine phosphatase)
MGFLAPFSAQACRLAVGGDNTVNSRRRNTHPLGLLRVRILAGAAGLVALGAGSMAVLRASNNALGGGLLHSAPLTAALCIGIAVPLGMVLAFVYWRRLAGALELLREGFHRLELGHLDSNVAIPESHELHPLARSFNQMSESLTRARDDRVTRERRDIDLKMARDFQNLLIPRRSAPLKGYEVEVYYRAASDIGGDYVDVIPLDERRTGFVIADVSAKGMSGLLVTAMLKIQVAELAMQGIRPSEVVRRLNESLARNLEPNMYVTLFFAILDSATGELMFSNAGHTPPVLYERAKGSCRSLKLDGAPLGVFPDEVFAKTVRDYHVALAKGDIVLQYSNGLDTSRDKTGQTLGIERVLDLLKAFAGGTARDLVKGIIDAETDFRNGRPQTDDITLLAIRATAGKTSPAAVAGT